MKTKTSDAKEQPNDTNARRYEAWLRKQPSKPAVAVESVRQMRERQRDEMIRAVNAWWEEDASGLDALASHSLDTIQGLIDEVRP